MAEQLPPRRRGAPEVVRTLPASLRGAACKVIWDKRHPGECEGFYYRGLQAIHHSPFEPLLRPEQNGKRLCFLEEPFLNAMASFEALSKGYFYFVFVFLKSPPCVSPPTRPHTTAWHHAQFPKWLPSQLAKDKEHTDADCANGISERKERCFLFNFK